MAPHPPAKHTRDIFSTTARLHARTHKATQRAVRLMEAGRLDESRRAVARAAALAARAALGYAKACPVAARLPPRRPRDPARLATSAAIMSETCTALAEAAADFTPAAQIREFKLAARASRRAALQLDERAATMAFATSDAIGRTVEADPAAVLAARRNDDGRPRRRRTTVYDPKGPVN